MWLMAGAVKLTDGPGISAIDHCLEGVVVVPQAGGQRHLVTGQIVIRRRFNIAEDANRCAVQHTGIGQPGKREGEGWIRQMSIVYGQRVLTNLGHLDHGEGPGLRIPDDAEVAVDTETDLLAMSQRDDRISRRGGLLDRIESPVVEDRAVLVDLDQRAAAVRGSRPQHSCQVLSVRVDGPRNKGCLGAERERDRVERIVQRAIGVDLVILPISEVGEYWPLVSP